MNRPFKTLTPSTGIATGLMAPLALGAPGNLDPGFADHGRALLATASGGSAWSLEALDEDRLFVAGGDVEYECSGYWYYDCEKIGSNFAGELTGEGQMDASYTPAVLADIEVRDAARQPDGKFIMVGRRLDGWQSINSLVVYRLSAGGALDTTFGAEGFFELTPFDPGSPHVATAVIVDPDGRIVVSGSMVDHLFVLRLLPDGTPDASFGDGGTYIGPLQDFDARTFVERTGAGSYRVATTGESQCRVLGLTAAGAIDGSFGTAGIAVPTPGDATACDGMASQADGSLVLVGSSDGQAFATRLHATGAPDAGFSAQLDAAMTAATAIAVAGDGKVLVAGGGEPGAMVVRLGPDGVLDASFGEAGTTLIDLPAEWQTAPRVNALAFDGEGLVLAAGGDSATGSPFVVRLFDDAGQDSAGIISFTPAAVEAVEGSNAVIRVRRTGGKSGSVSVNYRTESNTFYYATAGTDYDPVNGTLTWADGDASEREIVVPVHDETGGPEEYEGFAIELADVQGGAGLGRRNDSVLILPDGDPAGQFSLGLSYSGNEPSVVTVWVFRNFYFDGAVSVTVTPVAGSATAGEDFDATPVTLSWGDKEEGPKTLEFQILDDDERETNETFDVELSNPTGGAILGPYATAEVVIPPNDGQRISGSGRGGGGSTGWFSLLLLALAGSIRWVRAERV